VEVAAVRLIAEGAAKLSGLEDLRASFQRRADIVFELASLAPLRPALGRAGGDRGKV